MWIGLLPGGVGVNHLRLLVNLPEIAMDLHNSHVLDWLAKLLNEECYLPCSLHNGHVLVMRIHFFFSEPPSIIHLARKTT